MEENASLKYRSREKNYDSAIIFLSYKGLSKQKHGRMPIDLQNLHFFISR